MRILFIRGLTREVRHWNGFPEYFQKETGHTVYAFDLPGAGKRYKETSPTNINLYVESLRHDLPRGEPVVLVGISMGGMIALRWAELYPHEVKSVFVINSSAGNLSSTTERFNINTFGMLFKMLVTSKQESKERRVLELTTNMLSDSEKENLSNKFARYAEECPVSTLSSMNQLMAARKFAIYSTLTVPVVFIYGTKDRLVSSECSKKMASLLKAKSEIHPEAGHDLPLDDPQWLLSAITKHT